jgi:hypothetical protein
MTRRICAVLVLSPLLLGAAAIAAIAFPAAQTGHAADAPEHAEQKRAKLPKAPRQRKLSSQARLAFIRRAQVWAPTNISEMDLRAGPEGSRTFQPNEMVTCDYVKATLPGTTQKFDCRIGSHEVVKVRYGSDNGKVEGAVIASRLLRALGFGADRLYPVRVTCRGCSADPWNKPDAVVGAQVFDPAAIELKPAGEEMKGENKGGWAWPELDLVQEQQGGASTAQRDALKLFAVFIQHTDNKAEQERLLCLPGGWAADGTCTKPFMMMHDVGLTFGHANFLNRTVTGSVNFDQWSTTPIWRDRASCVAHMSQSYTGTLGDPTISEGGRKFLADLLVQLSDQQLRDVFEVARVDRRSRKPNSGEPPASVDAWVAAFKNKRAEILSTHCPS